MAINLYDKRHLREYVLFGLIAAIAYSIPVWIFFLFRDYNRLEIVFLGVVLFLFVIMLYAIKLSKRRPEYKSAWMMVVATHSAVVTGVILSVVFTTLLCFVFIPSFLSGHSESVLANAPSGMNDHNWSFLGLLYLCATVANFGAGGFIAVLGPYVFKKNQTKEKTPQLETEINVDKS